MFCYINPKATINHSIRKNSLGKPRVISLQSAVISSMYFDSFLGFIHTRGPGNRYSKNLSVRYRSYMVYTHTISLFSILKKVFGIMCDQCSSQN